MLLNYPSTSLFFIFEQDTQSEQSYFFSPAHRLTLLQQEGSKKYFPWRYSTELTPCVFTADLVYPSCGQPPSVPRQPHSHITPSGFREGLGMPPHPDFPLFSCVSLIKSFSDILSWPASRQAWETLQGLREENGMVSGKAPNLRTALQESFPTYLKRLKLSTR